MLESTPSKDNESLVDPSDVAILGAVGQQGTVKSPPRRKQRKKRLPLLNLLNLLLVQWWIQRLHNLMKNGPTDSIGWKHFCWPGLTNRHSHLMLK